MALTLGSVSTVRKDWLTVSDVALPPVSRKLVGAAPMFVNASTVFIARPAPFTITINFCLLFRKPFSYLSLLHLHHLGV